MPTTERRLIWLSTLVSVLACCLLATDLFLRIRPPMPVTRRPRVLPLPADYSALSVEELAMRFRQPNFYAAEAEHDMPRWAAVREMLRRGLLRRGIRTEEAEFLLGEPYNATPEVPIQQMDLWLYSNGLILRFTSDHRLSECLHDHDGEPGDAKTDDLFARTP